MPETNIYDYEFSVRESEPKRAEMLNRLKDRVQHVDKKEVISSDEYVEGETNFSEDKALSAFLLYKLFPSKAKLLKDHYTKDQVDNLLGDLIAKYYLKDQIDSLLNNLKNELKSSLDNAGSGALKKLNDLKGELSKHRTLDEIDHPDASVTTRKLRDRSVTKEKLSDGLTTELDNKLNKNGDTITGPLKFAYSNPILMETGPGTGKYHRIGSGSTLEEIAQGKAHLDLGDYDGNTYETNLCCVSRPGWYNSTTKEVKQFALQEEIEMLNNKVNNMPKGGGGSTFAKISANKIWSGRVTARNATDRSNRKFKVCDLPSDWQQIIVYSSIQQSASDGHSGWYNYMTGCFAILVKGVATDVIAGYQGEQEVKSFFVEGNTLYMRGLTPNGDDVSVFSL
jgi:hypothetical protein|nr:MAG TPA: hypothetical protein [Caudoviricetes sp.]